MHLASSPFTQRVEESVEFLSRTLTAAEERLGALSAGAVACAQHTRHLALGGKHVRALLVHVSADRPAGTPTPEADIAVAAAFDLLHCAFLIIDDIIDNDDVRRGNTTLHAMARDKAVSLHGVVPARDAEDYGRSVATLAGMAAQNYAFRLVLESGADPATTAHLLRLFSIATGASVAGEFMDVHHSLPNVHPDAHDIAITNRLKTSSYSFEAPLIAGQRLAGRSDHHLELATALGRDLGAAYQLADDLRDVYAPGAVTGKTQGSDLYQKRATALISFATTTDAWPEIERALDATEVDTQRIAQMLADCGALADAQASISAHLDHAHRTIDDLALSADATDVLHEVADTIVGSYSTFLP
ncbi:polyprenyl synthetase family protein [Corynebacterium sp. 13CS0277]|uniref:polyprenyl synthetase family protein n=1 Tax=Corynebacterium sp. 13CS0277 TaxID=2071994 RepID=UPI001304D478|nr:polyprenyl synthetase family protein [Corynebacterium sp. 13CS0277]